MNSQKIEHLNHYYWYDPEIENENRYDQAYTQIDELLENICSFCEENGYDYLFENMTTVDLFLFLCR